MVPDMNSNREQRSKRSAQNGLHLKISFNRHHNRSQGLHHHNNHHHHHHHHHHNRQNDLPQTEQRRNRKGRNLERFRDYSVKGDDRRLWRLDDIEFRPDLQRVLNHRYCNHCAKSTDHSTRMCNNFQEDICIVCAGEHNSEQCDEMRCAKCNRGHHERNCPIPAEVMRCENCQREGHFDMLCTSNWRSFAMITSLEESSFHDGGMVNIPVSTENKHRFCSNCGSTQHFYSDCTGVTNKLYQHIPNVHTSLNLDDQNRKFEDNLALIQIYEPEENLRKRRCPVPFAKQKKQRNSSKSRSRFVVRIH